MTSLVIEGTKTKPYVNFDSDSGKLLIGGESYPGMPLNFTKVFKIG